ncbi:hypothetical protein B0H14DRAFT_3495823 [Mycena olivaceomarginata]|nr:hypothetical protein B0H14DRAFT_3495823 [Mycena olivaceomarginata]
MAPTESQKSRKVHERDKNPPKPKQPAAKPGPKPAKNLPHTSACYEKDEWREDLTYSDWVDVFDYWDEHPKMSQMAVVKYFSSQPDAEGGKLLFQQPALSKKAKHKDKIRALVATAEPNILSMKRARVVTSPEVDKALGLWVQDMERKRRTVTGPACLDVVRMD